MLNAVGITASVLMGVGMFVGAAIALIGLFVAPEMEAMANLVRRAYWTLVILLPLGLWLGLYATNDEEESGESYDSLLGALAVATQAALIGGGLGAGPFFLLATSYAPVILSNYDITVWAPLLRNQILWMPWLVVVGITFIAALPLAYWVFRARAAAY